MPVVILPPPHIVKILKKQKAMKETGAIKPQRPPEGPSNEGGFKGGKKYRYQIIKRNDYFIIRCKRWWFEGWEDICLLDSEKEATLKVLEYMAYNNPLKEVVCFDSKYMDD